MENELAEVATMTLEWRGSRDATPALTFTFETTGRPPARRNVRSLAFLEHRGLEPVPLQELVELGAVAFGKQRGLGDIAARDLEQAHEIVALECLARFLERHQSARVLPQRTLDKRCRNEARRRERDGLLEQVQELPDIAGPRAPRSAAPSRPAPASGTGRL